MSDTITPDQREIRHQIRSLFTELGGNLSIAALVQEVLDRGLIPEHKRKAMLLRGIAEVCREALMENTEKGLPFAKPLAARGVDAYR
jgi:hypothetical protein